MQLVSFLTQKGGGGKTTAATNFAVAAANAGRSGIKTLLLDLDPQQSSTRWGNWRAQTNPTSKASLLVQAASLSNVAEKIGAAQAMGVKLCVIDTPPAASKEASLAARAAQLVFVVVQPSILDLSTLGETFSLRWVAARPAYVLLNRVPTGKGTTLQDAVNLVSKAGYPIAKTKIFDRAAYRTAPKDGLGVIETEPKSPAADEVRALFQEAREILADKKAPDPLPIDSDDLFQGLDQ